jgi:hypothetical protein
MFIKVDPSDPNPTILIPVATDSVAGLLSAADKTKLDGLDPGNVPGDLAVGGDAVVQGNVLGTGFIDTVNTDGARLPQGFQATGDSSVAGALTVTSLTVNGVPIGAVEPAAGADLIDADDTVNPASSKISASTLREPTLTAARVLTIGVTGSPVTSHAYQVIRRDLSAYTYTVKDDAGTTLFTFAASPTAPQGASFYFDGTHYKFLSFYYVA